MTPPHYINPAEPTRGLLFDGRIAEDFKLSSGTFVSVGPLRARVTLAGDPLVQDVVVAAPDRDALGLLVFPRIEDAKRLFSLPATMPAAEVLAQPPVRAFFQALIDRLWREGTGSANRPARLLVMAQPPLIDRGEVTDKGIDQPACGAAAPSRPGGAAVRGRARRRGLCARPAERAPGAELAFAEQSGDELPRPAVRRVGLETFAPVQRHREATLRQARRQHRVFAG